MQPEGFALIDVADAGADPLVEQELADRRPVRLPSSPHDFIQVEMLRQDIRAQVLHRLAAVAYHLHHGC